jgi:pyruvate dehydrogenase E1 component alpha subunit
MIKVHGRSGALKWHRLYDKVTSPDPIPKPRVFAVKILKPQPAVQESGPSHLPGERKLADMLYYMKLTREIEDRIERKLYRQGKIVGGVYVGRGQEAITVGSVIDLEDDDAICVSHRDMAAFLMRGVTPRQILAQYMGRKTGLTGGKDANMHMGSIEKGLIAFVSMLGDSIPIAAGVGLSFKIRKSKQIAMCFFGDGATSRGDWHEGMNMAAVLNCPVVFVCNNNQYAYSTPLERQMPVANVADRAYAYGMPGEIVDGNDVVAVWEAVGGAIRRARQGQGSSLIECKTFRMTGHSAHDDASYVPSELFEEWKKKDPIVRLESALLEREVLTADEIREMTDRVRGEIDEAVALAEADPLPAPEDCLKGVYSDES